jgi:hypothetical protein
MKPITAKEFLTLEIRDFENGACRDEIYEALKEREKLLPLPDTSWEKSLLTREEAKTMIASLSNTIAELEKQKAKELPEITETWAHVKAKEIFWLIKNGQDEDLTDPALALHYLALATDIVTSIINDLRPKNK